MEVNYPDLYQTKNGHLLFDKLVNKIGRNIAVREDITLRRSFVRYISACPLIFCHILMTHNKKEKIPLSTVKKFPYRTLNRLINKMRKYLKNDPVMQQAFKDYDVDIDEIDYIPMMFGDIDVSAKTDHSVIIFNYKLLADGDFKDDYSYGAHEITHYLQQTTGKTGTRSANDGEYLDNPAEREGFSNQIEYIANHRGEDEAEKYVDDLLEYHDITDKEKKDEIEDALMSKV